MYAYGIAAQLVTQLSDSLHKWGTLNVADGAAHLGNDKVEALVKALAQHAVLNLICDMWHYLDRFTQVVAATLTVDYRFINASCCYAVVSCCVYACKSLVVSQVQVGLKAVGCYVALAVLVGVQRARVDVNVRVEFLYSYFVAACLQQLSNAGRYNSLA